jgi:integrase
MKLYDRESVGGTANPTIYIGHRYRKESNGEIVISPKWHADWNYLGTKGQEALKTTNKAEALRKAKAISQRLTLGEGRPVSLHTEWDELIDAYLNSKRRAPTTMTKYTQVLKRFVEFAKDRNRSRPEHFTSTDFWTFSTYLSEEYDNDEGTIEDQLVIVKQVFKWAVTVCDPQLLVRNPIAAERVDEAEDGPQPCFDGDQVARLLEMADEHHRPIWAVMAYLGLRFGEVRDLRWSDFNFKLGAHGWVHIQRGGSGKRTKGKKSRRIPLNEDIRKYLDVLPHHEDGRLFHQQPSKKYPEGGRPLKGDKLLKSVKRLCKRCGFENPDQYKQHTFRHAFASMLARAKVGLQQALDWMGHEDSAILKLYIKLYDKDAEKAIASIRYEKETAA